MDPLTRGDPTSPLRWTCKSRAKLAAALTEQGWRVSSTTVGRLLHRLGYRLQSPRKRQEGATHPDRNAQFEHINQTADKHLAAGQPVVSVDTKKKTRLTIEVSHFPPGPSPRSPRLRFANCYPDEVEDFVLITVPRWALTLSSSTTRWLPSLVTLSIQTA